MTRIFNKILTTYMFPSRFSVAKLKCIFKSGDRKFNKNYRPISILPGFSKISEKIITL